MSRHEGLSVTELETGMSTRVYPSAGIGGVPETVTDTAACSLDIYQSNLVTTAAAVPTLADGLFVGQSKRFVHTVHAVGDAVLTPANFTDGTTITFSVVGDAATLAWDGSGWRVLELDSVLGSLVTPVVA